MNWSFSTSEALPPLLYVSSDNVKPVPQVPELIVVGVGSLTHSTTASHPSSTVV